MPLRRWFADRGAEHPVTYSMITLAAGAIACMFISILVSVQLSERNKIESDRRLCASIASDVRAYLETPPATEAGRNQLRAKQELLRALRCPDGKG